MAPSSSRRRPRNLPESRNRAKPLARNELLMDIVEGPAPRMNREPCGSGPCAGEARGSMGAIFVALVLVLGAGSVGGVLVRFFGFDQVEAAVVGIGVLWVLGLCHALEARGRHRAESRCLI